ncbi:zinc ribbon domain-containing protein [Kocuria palustris]|jgi:putative FmdB family regulatory protein|uniref:FmdB family zinc ribbon protein n=1 Tax=Kocuria palustris TaxID=71999 RepID=UPI0019D1BD60|nr:FmdB family zinc ribbon protein [Kocuria palustris]MBN6752772.1 zinc ribbon domain-containing protein [Kocuria palustris]MBN6757727.1 zinc ribbon domain-containing protein [Kocuria palustris]MBN6762755.1 zinc ribbon domain-containing protein [Kocuria palustris]MBN6782237.1 zinc ribbon domain-containing protein [Kocuria palustris]MBN6798654.1 zinc ribbon domain-containing protein [Kocuria palustris]
MPVYAYKCKSCGHQLEVRQSFSDAPLSECPQCGGELRKQFNSVGVVFKGSGFYRNDSRASSSSSSASSSESSTSGTSSSSSASSNSSD